MTDGMRLSTWLPVLVLVAGLGIGREAIAAPKKVDWSEYLEPPGARVAERPAKETKASKAKAKKAAKAKAKKSKRSARKTRRR